MKDDDGLKRNLKKLWAEAKRVNEEMKPHWSRFFKSIVNPTDTLHAYTNLFVESRRSSPYLLGHIDAILYPVLIIALIWIGA